ncbi:MAG: carbohydrate ABC transporter permease [Alphaproteobacteria bacterium]|nr:carbohydrate ABC transporter permease [Alphaproteobacteria bacterium]
MKPSLARRAMLLLGCAVVATWTVFPFAWYLLVSLTTPGHIPRRFEIPDVLTLRSYGAVLFGGDFVEVGAKFSVLPNIVNSLIVASLAVAISISVSFGSAYVFSRRRSRLLTIAFNGLLLIRMTPAVSLAVPIFLMMSGYGLLDTHIGLALVHAMLSMPLSIWLIKGFIDGIPVEVEEAAYIDGASFVQVLRHVVVPLAAPGVAVTACFVFLASYIEFMFALIMSRGTADTLPLAIAGYHSEHQTFYNEMAAASFISMIPLALFFYLAGRYMVGGLTMGAVK